MDFEKILALDEMPLKEELKKHLKNIYDNVSEEDGFLYAEGEVPVLLIAHLDTVHKNLAPPICWSKDKRFIMSPNGIGGDDRCGVYMILEIIKEFKCSVLFCEQEEVGCVGAKKFCTSGINPDVNYIMEFDRKGSEDSVFYDCENKDFEKFINSVGFKTQWGSCSDISKIAPHLGVAAVNLSSGYYNAHCLYEFIDMHFVEKNIGLAKKLLEKNTETKYEYIEKKRYTCNYKDKYDYKGKNKNELAKKEKNKFVSMISMLLMKVDPEEYWIFAHEWGNCPKGINYYIDCAGSVYTECGNVCKKIDTEICSKETLLPPEFVRKNASLCKVSIYEDELI